MAQKRSIEVNGHQTSLNLEIEFWDSLNKIAAEQNISVQDLIEQIKQGYEPSNLTSAVRLFVLKHYQRSKGAASQG
jgi:predicted DNA-binding ribbon-helix-helix protein